MLFIISSPSGAGKSTLCKHLIENFKNLEYSISVTTRTPRSGETNGVEYYFHTIKEFEEMKKAKKFIETAKFCENLYGTLNSEISRIELCSKNVLFDIDYNGKNQIISNKKLDCVTIFILPPSIKILKERLQNRHSESEDIINVRLDKAKEEMTHAKNYDYVIINENIDIAKNEISVIYQAENIKRKKVEYLNNSKNFGNLFDIV